MLTRVKTLLIVALLVLGACIETARAKPAAPPLVTPAWLRVHLHEKSLVVLDIYLSDKQHATYAAGHIPGAVFTGFFSDGWRASVGGVPGLLPPQDKINAVIGGFGIGLHSRVILVPGGKGLSHPNTFNAATWIYWALNALGNHRVSILNGGDDAWRANRANPIAAGSVTPHAVEFAGHLQSGYNATTATVAAAMKAHQPVLVDARPEEYYTGEAKSPATLKAGTIPGAVNLPSQSLLTDNGQGLLRTAKLEQRIKQAGIKRGAAAITFCNTSYWASGAWFVLRAVEHNPHVLLYNGSMAAWTRQPNLPVVPGQPRS